MMEQGDPIRSLVVKITGNLSLTLLDKKFWQPGKTYQEKEVDIEPREWRKEKNPVSIKNRQKGKVWNPLYFRGEKGETREGQINMNH